MTEFGMHIAIHREAMHKNSWVEIKPPLWKQVAYALTLRKAPVKRVNMLEVFEAHLAEHRKWMQMEKEAIIERLFTARSWRAPRPDSWTPCSSQDTAHPMSDRPD